VAKEYPVTVEYVVGNESRMGDVDWSTDDVLLAEDFDYLILNNLRMILEPVGVKFNKPSNLVETVMRLPNGFNAVLTHGATVKGPMEKFIGTLLAKHLYKGTKIHGVFTGHIHSASMGDIHSRSGSLCGGNAYSGGALHFVSRASHNAYIAYADHYDGMKFDLQDVGDVEGYSIIDELEHYSIQQRKGNTRVVIENLV
jgi:hypothetical protein